MMAGFFGNARLRACALAVALLASACASTPPANPTIEQTPPPPVATISTGPTTAPTAPINAPVSAPTNASGQTPPASGTPEIVPPIDIGPAPPPVVTPNTLVPLAFGQSNFADLPQWGLTDVAAARRAFVRQCALWATRPNNAPLSPNVPYAGNIGQWRGACAAASNNLMSDASFFEANFTPWLVVAGDDPGHITSYFEPVMSVSSVRTPEFSEPLLGVPQDLVLFDPHGFDPSLNSRQFVGQIYRQGAANSLRPYPPRADIGPNNAPVLAWGRMGEVLSLQIQGSGQINFTDGHSMRAAFAAHNGRPFGSVARELIRRGELAASSASADAITRWFANANPAEARSVINANPRTVFFRLETAPAGEGPRGAATIPLEAGGAIAVDPAYHAYGVPVFLFVHAPRLNNSADSQFTRLVVAQDTGGAIRGPLRADLFWGTGVEAGLRAGRINHQAQWWVLLPKGLDPLGAGQ